MCNDPVSSGQSHHMRRSIYLDPFNPTKSTEEQVK